MAESSTTRDSKGGRGSKRGRERAGMSLEEWNRARGGGDEVYIPRNQHVNRTTTYE
jgi:hypothetical protein